MKIYDNVNDKAIDKNSRHTEVYHMQTIVLTGGIFGYISKLIY